MATKKVYLVDTENVGSTWKDLLPVKTGTDQILLFFTENSPYVSYTDLQLILQFPDRFEMIKCNPGKNGLDFQLVTYLGYLLKTASKSNYVIVSNDGGFDAVVRFWQERGMSVSRTNVYHVLQPAAAETQVQTQPAAAPASAAAPVQKAPAPVRAQQPEAPKTKRGRSTAVKKNGETRIRGAARGRAKAKQTAKAGTAVPENTPAAASSAAPSPDTEGTQNAESVLTFTGETVQASAAVPETETAPAAVSAERAVETSSGLSPEIFAADAAVLDAENIELDFSNLTVSEKAALLRKYLPEEFSENQESLDIISDIMFGHDTTNHHQLHLAFVKSFGDERGTVIYKAFRPHLAEFRA